MKDCRKEWRITHRFFNAARKLQKALGWNPWVIDYIDYLKCICDEYRKEYPNAKKDDEDILEGMNIDSLAKYSYQLLFDEKADENNTYLTKCFMLGESKWLINNHSESIVGALYEWMK